MNNVITYEISKDEDVPNVRCPFCFLQPIVENCLKHGIKGILAPLHVAVHIYRLPDGVGVDVAANGVGIQPDAMEELNQRLLLPHEKNIGHVGFGNVSARIRYYYGSNYGLRFLPNPGGGIICRIRLGEQPATVHYTIPMQKEAQL